MKNTTESKPVIENDLKKVAEFMGVGSPEKLSEIQTRYGLEILGPDASTVVYKYEGKTLTK